MCETNILRTDTVAGRQCKDIKSVERIRRMETCFDAVQAVLTEHGEAEREADVSEMLAELVEYYDSGQWLEDYERDERGELPADLKRGVLSEDGIYNMLADLKERA